MSVKVLDYHFKIAFRRLWHLNVGIAESYLKKWILWISGSRMSDMKKLGKTMKRYIDGILERYAREKLSCCESGHMT